MDRKSLFKKAAVAGLVITVPKSIFDKVKIQYPPLVGDDPEPRFVALIAGNKEASYVSYARQALDMADRAYKTVTFPTSTGKTNTITSVAVVDSDGAVLCSCDIEPNIIQNGDTAVVTVKVDLT